MAFLRQISLPDAAIYIVAQLGGAVGGALLTKALLLDEGKDVNYGAVGVSDLIGGDTLPGMVVEAIGTFFLVWVIVGVAVNPRATKEWAALAIGATLGMLVMVLGPLTGGSFNPARALGPAIVGHAFNGTGDFLLVYIVAPVIGGVLGGVAYHYLVIAPGQKGLGGSEPVG
jgi:glycerol uptake facilitator-like aquaporin